MTTLVLGASRGVGKETAIVLSKNIKEKIIVASSSIKNLNNVNEFNNNFIKKEIDLSNFNSINNFLSYVKDHNIKIKQIIITSGINQKDNCNFDDFLNIMHTNFLGIVYFIDKISSIMKIYGNCKIICLSSVVSIRGRSKNYYYGSSKVALNHYLEGKKMELEPFNINITTILLGYTKTNLLNDKKLHKLAVSPTYVANKIFKLLNSKKQTVYIPWWWIVVSMILKSIPERIFIKFKF